MKIETKRLYLRELSQSDYPALCKILQDEETMYAYNGAFSNDETQNWLNKQLARYRQYGFGLWAVILKETDEMIGQCGLTMQDCDGVEVLEVGYLFQQAFWHNGYATEAAIACKNYAFNVLKADEVFSIIRDTNTASQNVAIRNGMSVIKTFTKHYRGVEMPHWVFSVKKNYNNLNINKMDTEELSTETYDGVLEEAENLSDDLTLQYGVLASDCENESEYLEKAVKLTKAIRTMNNHALDDIFYGNPPKRKELVNTCNKILENIERIKDIPFEKRHFEF